MASLNQGSLKPREHAPQIWNMIPAVKREEIPYGSPLGLSANFAHRIRGACFPQPAYARAPFGNPWGSLVFFLAWGGQRVWRSGQLCWEPLSALWSPITF